MKPEDFAGRAPQMVLEEFFAGRTQAWGIFQDRFGKLRQQFTVDIQGDWDPQERALTLTEDFLYDDGRTEQRIWTITKIDDQRYRATAADVIDAAEVRACGSAVNLTYRMKVQIAGKDWTLAFDDWMFRQNDEVVINRATVRKLGMVVGTATICFRKAPLGAGDSAAAQVTPLMERSSTA